MWNFARTLLQHVGESKARQTCCALLQMLNYEWTIAALGRVCSQHSVESSAVSEFVTAHSFHIPAQPLTHTVGRFLVFLVF